MSAIKFRSNVWKRTWQGARTNKWHTQWQRCFYNNWCGLTHQSANGCCPHGSNFLCLTHFPKVNCLGKISMIRQKNQRRNFNLSSCVIESCLKHIAKRTNVTRIMGGSEKIPRMKGRDLTLVRSIVVLFCLPPTPPPPLSLSLSLKFIGEITHTHTHTHTHTPKALFAWP